MLCVFCGLNLDRGEFKRQYWTGQGLVGSFFYQISWYFQLYKPRDSNPELLKTFPRFYAWQLLFINPSPFHRSRVKNSYLTCIPKVELVHSKVRPLALWSSCWSVLFQKGTTAMIRDAGEMNIDTRFIPCPEMIALYSVSFLFLFFSDLMFLEKRDKKFLILRPVSLMRCFTVRYKLLLALRCWTEK